MALMDQSEKTYIQKSRGVGVRGWTQTWLRTSQVTTEYSILYYRTALALTQSLGSLWVLGKARAQTWTCPDVSEVEGNRQERQCKAAEAITSLYFYFLLTQNHPNNRIRQGKGWKFVQCTCSQGCSTNLFFFSPDPCSEGWVPVHVASYPALLILQALARGLWRLVACVPSVCLFFSFLETGSHYAALVGLGLAI